MRLRRLLLPILSATAFAFALLSIARTQPQRLPEDPPAAPPTSPYAAAIAAVGLVEPSSENLAIGSHLTGIVDRVAVTVGARVQRGETLFALDARHLDAGIETRRAVLAAALEHVAAQRIAAEDAEAHLAFAETVTTGAIAREELSSRRFAAATQGALLQEAEAGVEVARRELEQALVERERSEVRAPIDGVALKIDVRPGEAVQSGENDRPLVLLGEIAPLHVRVDVDENDAWRVHPGAGARAMLRGQSAITSPLTFVRFEPYVTPKHSLTGDSTERVDTRVLQVIYRIDQPDERWFVGQQVDVFIEDHPADSAKMDLGNLPAAIREVRER